MTRPSAASNNSDTHVLNCTAAAIVDSPRAFKSTSQRAHDIVRDAFFFEGGKKVLRGEIEDVRKYHDWHIRIT